MAKTKPQHSPWCSFGPHSAGAAIGRGFVLAAITDPSARGVRRPTSGYGGTNLWPPPPPQPSVTPHEPRSLRVVPRSFPTYKETSTPGSSLPRPPVLPPRRLSAEPLRLRASQLGTESRRCSFRPSAARAERSHGDKEGWVRGCAISEPFLPLWVFSGWNLGILKLLSSSLFPQLKCPMEGRGDARSYSELSCLATRGQNFPRGWGGSPRGGCRLPARPNRTGAAAA